MNISKIPNESKHSKETGKDMMILFHSTHCGACKRLKPDFAANPTIVHHGDDVQMAVELNVTNATGVGEFRLAVDGPGSATPISQSFFLKDGIPAGEQAISVKLTVQDGQDQQGFPKTFEQGVYNFTFHVCQGECGSSHPHSKDFGNLTGTFTLNDNGVIV